MSLRVGPTVGVWRGAATASAARLLRVGAVLGWPPWHDGALGVGRGCVARPPWSRVSNPFATSLANTRQKALDTLRWAS